MYHNDGNVKTKSIFGHTPWMSNMFPYNAKSKQMYADAPPLRIVAHGRTYSSVEAAYQACKAHHFDEKLDLMFPERHKVRLFDSFPSTIGPMEAKNKAGKGGFVRIMRDENGLDLTVKRAGEVYEAIKKPSWFDKSIEVMRGLLCQKFDHPALAACLLRTGDLKLYEIKGRGKSIWEKGGSKSTWGVLGDLLMEIRANLRKNSRKRARDDADAKDNNKRVKHAAPDGAGGGAGGGAGAESVHHATGAMRAAGVQK